MFVAALATQSTGRTYSWKCRSIVFNKGAVLCLSQFVLSVLYELRCLDQILVSPSPTINQIDSQSSFRSVYSGAVLRCLSRRTFFQVYSGCGSSQLGIQIHRNCTTFHVYRVYTCAWEGRLLGKRRLSTTKK